MGFRLADRERIIWRFCYALRQWMRENGIEMQQNEPEDHFGSLLRYGGPGLPRMTVIMNANNSRPASVSRGRPAF